MSTPTQLYLSDVAYQQNMKIGYMMNANGLESMGARQKSEGTIRGRRCLWIRWRKMLDTIILILKELVKSRFFGIIELRFEDGKVVHIRKTENIKP